MSLCHQVCVASACDGHLSRITRGRSSNVDKQAERRGKQKERERNREKETERERERKGKRENYTQGQRQRRTRGESVYEGMHKKVECKMTNRRM